MSGVGEPGHTDGKRATGHSFSRVENLTMLECYYSSNPKETRYIERMWDQRILWDPTSKLTKKKLLTQCSNVWKRNQRSELEIDEVQQGCYGIGEPGRKVRGVTSSSSTFENRYQAPFESPDNLNTRVADLRLKITNNLDT